MEDLKHDLTHRFEADSVSRALELVGENWTLLLLACRRCGGEIDARNVTPERGAGVVEPRS
jgi:hypothetical protein